MPTEASNFAKVFAAEAAEIAAQCKLRGVAEDLNLDGTAGTPYPDRFGLAFSGGGVRSASVALGVTQRLAKAGVLRQVHYMSAISGGAYLMSWLTAWIKRTSFDEVEQAQGYGAIISPPSKDTVQRFLEPAPLHFLRRFISYLTPRFGLASGDTLAAIAIYLRNLLLNQIMLASALVSLTLILQLLSPRLAWSYQPTELCLWAVVVVTIALFGCAINKMSKSLNDLGEGGRSKQSKIMANQVIVCGAAVSVLIWLLLPAWHAQHPGRPWTVGSVVVCAVIGFFLTAPFKNARLNATVEKRRKVGIPVYMMAWTISGGLVCAIDEAFRLWLLSPTTVVVGTAYVVFGLGLLMLGLVAITFVFIGILGDVLADRSREWLARFAGYFILFSVVSMNLLAIELYGPMLVHLLFSGFSQPSWQKKIVAAIVPGGWLFIVLSGLIRGGSSKTSGEVDKSTDTMDLFVAIAPPVFLLGLLLVTSWGTHALALRILTAGTPLRPSTVEYLNTADFDAPSLFSSCSLCACRICDTQPNIQKGTASSSLKFKPLYATYPFSEMRPDVVPAQTDKPWKFFYRLHRGRARYFGLFLAAFSLAILLALRLDVNEFSMNLFYRNRLVRTFLGASNEGRKPNFFTGFAANDDIALDTLTTENKDKPFQGPYPIWGTTLNITAGEDLGWQQRKGASFIYSPLFCGWDYVNPEGSLKQPEEPAADDDTNGVKREPQSNIFGYRATTGEPGYGGVGGKPFIGTAMAASGAAASPNMGYHTRPGVAALLAIFNVRLGWWTGNPRNPTYWKEYAPGIWYLFAELFARATDSDRYVYLSDGGHFENLGIYELIRRRVRFIICSDGDADATFGFGDLANAVEHCRADFGVEITILAEKKFKVTTAPFRDTHYAIGQIKYPDSIRPGILLYIKSSLTDNEPADVLGLRATDTSFPHDTTANQFFNGTKFEAYRALGEHMMDSILIDCKVVDSGTPGRDQVAQLYAGLLAQLS